MTNLYHDSHPAFPAMRPHSLDREIVVRQDIYHLRIRSPVELEGNAPSFGQPVTICHTLTRHFISPVNSTTFINLLHKLERLYAIVFSGVQCPPEGRAPARSRCTEFTQSPITGTASSGYEHVCGLCGNRTRIFSVQKRHTPFMLRALFNIYYTTQFLFCQGSICISFLGYLFINHLVGVIRMNALLY